MALFYLDTSALLKRYNVEAGSDFIDFLFGNIDKKGNRLVTSFLTVIEMSGVVARMKKSKRITDREAKDIMTYFSIDVEKKIEIIPITDEILARAVKVSGTYGNKAADAIHVASIIDLNAETKVSCSKLIALVSDGNMYRTIYDNGITVINPEESDISKLSEFFGK